ncbi:MAG TPA: hypothetical protein VE445_07940, partial [Nitrososphaeraceae archaeon]|nr:hypothetical protein [Nitrososphaeraceae archaeon]
TAYETYYRALKEVSSTSKGDMISAPVIAKPIEIGELVKQIKRVRLGQRPKFHVDAMRHIVLNPNSHI